MTLLINRRRLAIAGATLLVGVVALAWYFQPDRRLARTWSELIAAVEARNPSRLHDVLAADYGDRWGHTRDSLANDARLAFLQLRELKVRPEQVTTQRDGDRATITAILRVEIEGGPGASEARVSINSIFTPFVFEWRRDPHAPWEWRLSRFDQPELDLARIRRAGDLPGW